MRQEETENILIKIIVMVILSFTIFIIIGGILIWSIERDKELMGWAESYEKCVQAEYGATPVQYYNGNGEYPDCDIKNY